MAFSTAYFSAVFRFFSRDSGTRGSLKRGYGRVRIRFKRTAATIKRRRSDKRRRKKTPGVERENETSKEEAAYSRRHSGSCLALPSTILRDLCLTCVPECRYLYAKGTVAMRRRKENSLLLSVRSMYAYNPNKHARCTMELARHCETTPQTLLLSGRPYRWMCTQLCTSFVRGFRKNRPRRPSLVKSAVRCTLYLPKHPAILGCSLPLSRDFASSSRPLVQSLQTTYTRTRTRTHTVGGCVLFGRVLLASACRPLRATVHLWYSTLARSAAFRVGIRMDSTVRVTLFVYILSRSKPFLPRYPSLRRR